LCGSVLAYWLSGIVNPAFVAIAVMILLFIPVFYNDYLHSAPPDNESPDTNKPSTNRVKPIKNKKSGKSLEAEDKPPDTPLLENKPTNILLPIKKSKP
jgi:hypothetical protein